MGCQWPLAPSILLAADCQPQSTRESLVSALIDTSARTNIQCFQHIYRQKGRREQTLRMTRGTEPVRGVHNQRHTSPRQLHHSEQQQQRHATDHRCDCTAEEHASRLPTVKLQQQQHTDRGQLLCQQHQSANSQPPVSPAFVCGEPENTVSATQRQGVTHGTDTQPSVGSSGDLPSRGAWCLGVASC